ncbi:MAG: cobaltochelatase subunit CobT, partial [Acetobacteraceae bacterium]
MSKQDLTRQEEFKRATAGTLRAIAHANAEVQVAFQPGPGGVSGKRVRLPLPTRALPAAEMAKLRGAADAAALRIRHHSETVHAARLPQRREAKEVYDALEDVRVEAVGSRHMSGVAANLRARLTDMCETEGYDRMTRKDQLPLPAALALLTRERISGEPAPAAAKRVLDLWRDSLGDRADDALAEMATATDDQDAFARAARKLLTALDLAEAEVEAEAEDQDDGEESGENSSQQDQSGEGEAQAQDQESMLGAQPETMQGEAAEEEAQESEDEGAAAEGDDKPGGPQQRREVPQTDDASRYHPFTTAHDEIVEADELCDPEELGRLRQ